MSEGGTIMTGANIRRLLRPFVIQSVFASVVAITLVLGAQYRFGSFSAALAYVRGESMFTDAVIKDLGDVPIGATRSISYRLVNLLGRPTKILGSRLSCTCSTVDELPNTLETGVPLNIEIKFTPHELYERFEGKLKLFTDDPHHPELVLTFVAHVISPPERLQNPSK